MTASTAAAAPSDRLDAAVLKVAFVVVLGAIMSILDTTVVSVAQNTFQEVFDTSAASTAWTMTGYTLALAAVIPLSGWAAARFGTKNVYLTSMVLFVAGSALCALAWSIGSLVVFRVIQGLGGGMLMPVGMMILTRAAGPRRIGAVMSVLGIPMMLGPIGGPILGGVLIKYISWHWIFLINVPIGAAAFIYSIIVLRERGEKSKPAFDFLGLLLLSPGLAAFLYGVSSSSAAGTFLTARVLIPAGIGIVLIGAFIVHALRGRATAPLIDLRLFGNRTLTWSMLTMTLFMVAFFGAALLFPQYYIGVRGQSTFAAGLLLAPQGIGAMVTMRMAGRLTDRIGPGKLALAGIGLIIVGLGVFIFVGPATSYWLLGAALFVQGLGMGMTMMPIMSAAMATLRPEEIPDGSTLMNVVQQVAASIGTAVIGVILANGIAASPDAGLAIAHNNNPAAAHGIPVPPVAFVHAANVFGTTFLVSVVLVVIALVPTYFLPRKAIADEAEVADGGTPKAPIMTH
ncbi:MAG TPA: DHA2 family efflux MFS transporter permease subunit [Pseudonocardiaceae bacterium]|jgi:EmrB/QacA subfamily drug resistance transporter|nr:DHA2 family efflux MFS transporter permease subunit [Pseudonocardiaceae bacterium]